MAPRRAAPPPTPAEIADHIASLVSIGDCTGARAYVASTGDSELAEKAFKTCIGGDSGVAMK